MSAVAQVSREKLSLHCGTPCLLLVDEIPDPAHAEQRAGGLEGRPARRVKAAYIEDVAV